MAVLEIVFFGRVFPLTLVPLPISLSSSRPPLLVLLFPSAVSAKAERGQGRCGKQLSVTPFWVRFSSCFSNLASGAENEQKNHEFPRDAQRNCTFWWRWKHNNGITTWKEIQGTEVKGKCYRWTENMWSPLEKRMVSSVRLACMVKSRRHTTSSMKGMNGDHNRGPGGWNVADWSHLRVIDAETDPDRGWFNSGI